MQTRILLVEDSETDAELALRRLRRSGIDCIARRVDNDADLRRELVDFRPDIVLSDFSMPGFDGMRALEVVRESHQDLPFIFLSGTIGEDRALAALKKGATDYLLKDAAARLVPAVERALRDSEQQQQHRRDIDQLALYDALTGLPNRKYLAERMEQSLARARQSDGAVAAFWLNLDRFQRVNEGFGRSFGDALLKSVSGRFVTALGKNGLLARMGSDQFVALSSELDSPQAAEAIAVTLRDCMDPPFAVADQEVFLTASIGVALYPAHAESGTTLLAHAETAMRQAKAGNGLSFYTPAMSAATVEKMGLETELRRAMERGELLLQYQPRVALNDGRITGVEALIRWQHPSRGMISPAQFIPIAEETGLIVPIGQWVLETACAQARLWRDAGQELRMAVNLSPRQFRQHDLVAVVAAALHKSGISASALELEVTESVAMDDPVRTREILTELKSLGLSIAIDDFGTGHSSLSYLNTFPLDFLKIDQSFIRGTPESRGNVAIVRTILSLAKNLNLEVIAEGVETESQMRFLQGETSCDAQGYLFSKPQGAGALDNLLSSGYGNQTGARPTV